MTLATFMAEAEVMTDYFDLHTSIFTIGVPLKTSDAYTAQSFVKLSWDVWVLPFLSTLCIWEAFQV